MKKRERGTAMRSTEPQARKVAEGIKKRTSKKKVAKKKGLNPTKPTAKSPPGIRKTKEQGEAELRKLREKQRKRVQQKKK